MAKGTIKNVGDILKNVREDIENYGANFSFVGVLAEIVGEKVLKPPMNSAISSKLGAKSHFLMR